MTTTSFVKVDVGGIPYAIALSDIEKFPGSFFECMIKKEWKNSTEDTISIQRDGALFKYVFAYLVTGNLPRDKAGLIDLDDATLEGLKAEADFYGLEALSKECKVLHRNHSELGLNSYMTIRKYIATLSECEETFQVDISSHLVRALKGIWSPFCVAGRISSYPYSTSEMRKKFYEESTIHSLNIAELIAAATQSPFGRGTETVVDTSVRNSFEIDASLLDSAVLNAISGNVKCASLAPHLNLTLRPYKLVIYKEGGHFNEHRDTVRGDGHIGTLVVILNSEYTGGELEVTHGDRTEVVTGPYKWVAMYGDCLHKINPVTSGTRVSLIYDIYGSAATCSDPSSTSSDDDENTEESEEEVEEEEEEEDDCEFWYSQLNDWVRKDTDGAFDKRRDPSDADLALVFKALDRELKSLDSIVICLQHLYPECQTNPAFLKGGDRALYDILTSGSSAYEVQVVAATIYRTEDNYEGNTTRCALFSPAIVKSALGLETDSDEDETAGVDSVATTGRTKLVLPNDLAHGSLLDYTPFIEHTGNESQTGKSVYIVAGLHVRRKV